jgi:hypothetical protein
MVLLSGNAARIFASMQLLSARPVMPLARLQPSLAVLSHPKLVCKPAKHCTIWDARGGLLFGTPNLSRPVCVTFQIAVLQE